MPVFSIAEWSFLFRLPIGEASRIAGSKEKLARILKGEISLEEVFNEGRPEAYQWQRVGEVVDIPAFIRSNTIQQAEQYAKQLGVKSVNYQQSLDIANDVNDIFKQIIQKGGVLPHHVEINKDVFISWGQQYQFDPDDSPAAFWVDYQTGDTYFYLNSKSSYWTDKIAYAKPQYSKGKWSTGHPDHPIWHELGHVMQYDNSPTAYQSRTQWTSAEKAIAGKVSQYAQEDIREFVAETFAALSLGGTLPNDVIALYQLYGGLLP